MSCTFLSCAAVGEKRRVLFKLPGGANVSRALSDF